MNMEVRQLHRGGAASEPRENKPSQNTPCGNSLAVKDMATSEHFLLVAIRNWVQTVKKKHNPMPLLIRGFELAQIPAALQPFDALMLITATSATRPLDVRCPNCTGLGDGEMEILSTVAFVQAHKSEWAFHRLGDWLPAAAARRALTDVESIAQNMATVELILPVRLEYLSRHLPNASDDQRTDVTFPHHHTVQ